MPMLDPYLSGLSQIAPGLDPSSGQRTGTNTNDDGAAGNIGEYLENKNSSGVTCNTTDTALSGDLTLTGGDWMVFANVVADAGASNNFYTLAVNSTTTTTGSIGENATFLYPNPTSNVGSACMMFRKSVPFGTTVIQRIVGKASNSTATNGIFFLLCARRVR